MLRRSVQSLEALLRQQPSATSFVCRSMATSARSSGRVLPASFFSPSPASAPARPFSSRLTASLRAQARRSFHSSRARRSHDGPKSDGTKTGGSAGASGTSGASGAADAHMSLSQRLKKLSSEYGWAAVGVYLGLSALDFPFCFLLVRTLGTDRIAAAEEVVINGVKAVIPESVKGYWRSYRSALKDAKRESGNETPAADEVEGWGVKEAEERVQHEASLATQLALAYAIHKSFIFVRVPLTAAVTPKVVKVLRSWGWKIGKPKSA